VGFAVLVLLSFLGAYRNEQTLREKWTALQSVQISQEVVREQRVLVWSRQAVASALCDIVLKLASDLKICDTDTMHRSLFGHDIQGRLFTDLLVGCDEEVRFGEHLRTSTASKTPVGMHATLKLVGRTTEAELS